MDHPVVKTRQQGRLFTKSVRRSVIFDWHLARLGREPQPTRVRPGDARQQRLRAARQQFWKEEHEGTKTNIVPETETNVRGDLAERLEQPKLFGDAETSTLLWRARVHLGHSHTCADALCCARDGGGVDDFEARAEGPVARVERWPAERGVSDHYPSSVENKFDDRGASYVVHRGTRTVEKTGRNAVRRVCPMPRGR
ncbi:hypothetical protein M885DRAFT_508603 [Pelagophyceae sp. CCMP2097]|nr:hypothetical protein M885DRAFT_508603 [Pelagophyceae sp. CCMP2097]